MKNSQRLHSEMKALIRYMSRAGLINAQRAPRRCNNKKSVEITFDGAENLATLLKATSYLNLYKKSVELGVYSVEMLDGTLLQMQYELKRNRLLRHRLAFLPNPWVEPFTARVQDYLEDNVNVDVALNQWPQVPLRFDFDRGSHADIKHPATHLTLSIVEGCRIPVTRPLTPYRFIDFVLRNFFDTDDNCWSDGLPVSTSSLAFDSTISQAESNLVHVAVPRGTHHRSA